MREYSSPKKMKRVGDLFAKYKNNLKPPQTIVEKVCVKVIKEVSGFDMKLDWVEYNVASKTIYIKTPSVIKSELKLKYPLILKKMEDEIGKKDSPNTIL